MRAYRRNGEPNQTRTDSQRHRCNRSRRRGAALKQLRDDLGDDAVEQALQHALGQQLMALYDKRDQLTAVVKPPDSSDIEAALDID